MKVGDMVSLRDVKNQQEHKWVVLSPLTLDEDEHVRGGRIHAVFGKNIDAEREATAVYRRGGDVLVVEGFTPGIKVGDLFVD
ncbi:MAG: hypothetical protein LBE35_07875 [Clostridiales bacterium]|nr:hypothetical protein [Clostridiales bacterium]